MKKKELDVMLRILPSYIKHMKKNPDSLLVKIFGVFTLKKQGMSAVHVMLMENTCQLKRQLMLRQIYDLKGSTYGRETKGKMNNKTIRKDLDWLTAKKKKRTNQLLQMSALNQELIFVIRRDT